MTGKMGRGRGLSCSENKHLLFLLPLDKSGVCRGMEG
jgi:hypothetical protein